MARIGKASLGVVPLLAAAFMSGCGDDETAYCVNSQDQVVQNQYCGDDQHGVAGYYWFFTSADHSYSAGQRVNMSQGTRISSTNRAAISNRGGFGGSAKSSGIGRAGGGGG